MNELFIPLAVAAVVEFVRKANERDFVACASIAGAALVGAICGYYNLYVTGVAEGIFAGLSASGSITIVQNNGKRV